MRNFPWLPGARCHYASCTSQSPFPRPWLLIRPLPEEACTFSTDEHTGHRGKVKRRERRVSRARQFRQMRSPLELGFEDLTSLKVLALKESMS
jgi:hypothetical protein